MPARLPAAAEPQLEPETEPAPAAESADAAPPEPPPVAEAEAPVRLPYPFNIMNPAEVPEWVLQQARAAEESLRRQSGEGMK